VAHTPHAVHFASSTKRGCLSTLAVKFPGVPETFFRVALVMISMLGCLADSTSLGAKIQIEQSLVGKVLSSAAITPPMAEDLSTK